MQDDDYVSIPETCGPSWWGIFHGVARAIRDDGCSSCGDEAVDLVSAMHDLVNQKLGKPLHDADNFQGIASRYAEAAASVGRPTPAFAACDAPTGSGGPEHASASSGCSPGDQGACNGLGSLPCAA